MHAVVQVLKNCKNRHRDNNFTLHYKQPQETTTKTNFEFALCQNKTFLANWAISCYLFYLTTIYGSLKLSAPFHFRSCIESPSRPVSAFQISCGKCLDCSFDIANHKYAVLWWWANIKTHCNWEQLKNFQGTEIKLYLQSILILL